MKTEKRRYKRVSVLPNDYFSIVVFGPFDVIINSKESIKSREMITARDGLACKVQTREFEGIIIAENVGILGKALESSERKGSIKVFVNCR